MSGEADSWLSPTQFRCLRSGLRVVTTWAAEDLEPEAALTQALHDEPALVEVVVGLATVSRLLAIELATATGATEAEVLARLDATVHRLQGTAHKPG
ncbi:hypothetical protein ACN28C_33375 [Plantactinospora sp. WMMC1484]|uniref:hypothetical protein n=1 Tax=Plantactinospora sp. WMMC1484 TaxID=3404122 RepID=UPI003BF55B9A